ncbi:hypothetical protein TNCV_2565081 [Trichonephila clavipes]|uniref:Uncharacterized protein n=1 Tax=Trichonephila clavipes TaxID=2585209 RepID=A0A8X6SFJ5_TRICX|nr:hypothetical protein TNCV_2565081 [Trichonephila clavipes]
MVVGGRGWFVASSKFYECALAELVGLTKRCSHCYENKLLLVVNSTYDLEFQAFHFPILRQRLLGRWNNVPVAQQSMRARNYYAPPNIRDHWALSCMNRCPDQVVSLKRDLQCLRPQARFVFIYRPNVAGMKGRVDLAQPVNRTQDLWFRSTIHYHSTLFGEK